MERLARTAVETVARRDHASAAEAAIVDAMDGIERDATHAARLVRTSDEVLERTTVQHVGAETEAVRQLQSVGLDVQVRLACAQMASIDSCIGLVAAGRLDVDRTCVQIPGLRAALEKWGVVDGVSPSGPELRAAYEAFAQMAPNAKALPVAAEVRKRVCAAEELRRRCRNQKQLQQQLQQQLLQPRPVA